MNAGVLVFFFSTRVEVFLLVHLSKKKNVSSEVVVCHRWEEVSGPPGLHTGARGLQTCTFERSRVFKTPPKLHEKTPEREEKNESCGGRGKKRAKFWAVFGKGCPAEGSPGKGGPGKGGPGALNMTKPKH